VRYLFYLLITYGLTLPAGLIENEVRESSDLVAWLKLACLAAFAWHAAALWRRQQEERASTLALAASIGTIWWTLATMFVYTVVTAMPFSLRLATESLEDSWRALFQVLGGTGAVTMLTGVAALAALAMVGAWYSLRLLGRLAPAVGARPVAALACVAGLAYLVGADARYIAQELVLYPRVSTKTYPFAATDFSMLPVPAGDSVFIVQLESVNSAALFTRAPEGFQRHIRVPGLETILTEGNGVLFPLFWANGRQTNRGLESILCGISGNVGEPLPADARRLLSRTCLPRQLAAAGFATVYLYAYFDLDFYNFGAFAKQAGFERIAFGDALMGNGAPRYDWGYDDCAFYERAFDYLQSSGLAQRKRVFAYFEVTANHWPFYKTHKHPEAHPYREPATPLQQYQNALAEQDYCLLTFWKRVRALGRDDIHLFVVPDHSWLTIDLPAESRFSTFLAYVPPTRRRAEFKPGTRLSPVPSQAQLYPTILELLGAPRPRQSFAFALHGTPPPADYDDCQLLFDGKLIAVRGDRRAELDLRTGNFWDFYKRDYCR